uniref:60S ribosomal protein L23 n=1 Tax=Aegilops tauschii TaxID=37682 RepID=R7W073_AEGTA
MADSDAESCGPLVAADDVRRGIFNRPRATGNQEALSDPFFDRPLEDHYEHLPSSYYIDLDVNKAVDVLLHCRILAECAADPDEIHPPSPMCPPCRPSPSYEGTFMNHSTGHGGSAGNKFRMSLGLPVAATVNCADNTAVAFGGAAAAAPKGNLHQT